MKNHQWEDFTLPGSKNTGTSATILFGNEPGRVLGPKEQTIYDHYVYFCGRLGIKPAPPEKWRMESQRIPNQ